MARPRETGNGTGESSELSDTGIRENVILSCHQGLQMKTHGATPMPRYSFYGVRQGDFRNEYANKDLASLHTAREEAKRLGERWFGSATAGARIEIVDFDGGTVLVVPVHENVWLDA